MDTARQIVRWALPGWTMLFFIMVFIVVSLLLHERHSELGFAQGTLLYSASQLIVPLAAASIPFGFLIYQIYYSFYWHFPFPSISDRKIFAEFIDRGKNILESVDPTELERVFKRRLEDAEDTPFTNRRYLPKWIKFADATIMNKYHENWILAQSAWYFALCSGKYANRSEMLNQRMNFLADIYHALGACRVAIFLGFAFYLFGFEGSLLLSDSASNPTPLSLLWAIVINLILTVLVSNIFRSGREDSYRALERLMRDVINDVMLTDKDEKFGQGNELTNVGVIVETEENTHIVR